MKTRERLFREKNMPTGWVMGIDGFQTCSLRYVKFSKPYKVTQRKERIAEMWKHFDEINVA